MTEGKEAEPKSEGRTAEPTAKPSNRRSRIFAVVLLLLVVYLVAVWRTGDWLPRPFGWNMTRSFDGDSQGLKQTQIVPTLDTPIEKGKNVIWCATLQAGWKQLQQKVTNGPVKLTDAEEVCVRLNNAPDPGSAMPPESFYANAGTTDKGIIETIHKEMTAKFPAHNPPSFEEVPPGGVVLYSYLEANVPFTLEYRDNPKPLEFTGSDGVKTAIRSFGFGENDYRRHKLKYQPSLLMLHCEDPPPKPPLRAKLLSFAIDLCHDSQPFQIVAARVPLKATLAATLDALCHEIAEFAAERRFESVSEGILQVPDLYWRLSHHCREIENHQIENRELQGQSIALALQDIQFRLDRSGAKLASQFSGIAASEPVKHESDYKFDTPFLLYVKKRGETSPFFVMWIDNAELLQRWE